MAVFMINICKFNGCGITFQSLGDLIQHIEDNHIDYDPHVIEQKEQQQPPCLPLSYVLRFFTEATRKDVVDVKPKVKLTPVYRPSSITQTVTPNGSEVDEDEVVSDFEDSNDSWTTPEEFSSEFILRHGSKMVTSNSSGANGVVNTDKPFACPVPGCKKRYKNVNGIKYHSKNGHKNDGRVRKGYRCHCGKSYKTGSGLKNHTAAVHTGSNMTTLTTQNGEVLQVPSSQVTTLQPIRALTLKHIANLGLPLKTLVVTTKSSVDKIVKPPSTTTSNDASQNLGVLTPATSPQSVSNSASSPPLPNSTIHTLSTVQIQQSSLSPTSSSQSVTD
ncbi:juxtaposed with another zinc finger protein 1 [Lycorma delicatula]|uniref:juxtaposed with another zinc finger protein 1 n=1 Tax=Lycorma delicatula TaxID=130591 RepID=UPI003F51886D